MDIDWYRFICHLSDIPSPVPHHFRIVAVFKSSFLIYNSLIFLKVIIFMKEKMVLPIRKIEDTKGVSKIDEGQTIQWPNEKG